MLCDDELDALEEEDADELEEGLLEELAEQGAAFVQALVGDDHRPAELARRAAVKLGPEPDDGLRADIVGAVVFLEEIGGSDDFKSRVAGGIRGDGNRARWGLASGHWRRRRVRPSSGCRRNRLRCRIGPLHWTTPQ